MASDETGCLPKIGLTGGIASGKSTVAEAFAELGIAVIYADQIARDVVQPGEPALAAIANAFGSGVIQADGGLNRAAMREIVFSANGQQARLTLEGITHPAINKAIEQQAFAATGPYVVLELPLLVEKQHYAWLNRVLVVDIDSTLQRVRLAERSGIEGEQAAAMLAAQATRQQRLNVANDVFNNGGSEAEIQPAVLALHQAYSQWASSGTPPAPLHLP